MTQELCPTQGVPPAADGEVAELVAALRADAECAEVEQYDLCNMTADQMRRAAALLEQLQPPQPVAPLKERPDFVAGYRAGLHDGRLEHEAAAAPVQGDGALAPGDVTDAELDKLERRHWEATGVVSEGLQKEELFNYRAFARAAIALDRSRRSENV